MAITMDVKEKPDYSFVLNPQKWPNWPFLPMKRYVQNKHLPEFGVIMTRMGLSTIFDANLFDLPKTEEGWKALKHKKYSSVEEMLQDGWIVD